MVIETMRGRLMDLAAVDVFGKGTILRVNDSAGPSKTYEYGHQVHSFSVEIVPNHGKLVKVPVTAKMQGAAEKSETILSDALFFNEIHMYREVLPKIEASEISSKLFYGEKNLDDPQCDILVIEDVSSTSHSSVEPPKMDYKHVLMSVRSIGKYHGLSYKMKQTSPDEFRRLWKPLLEIKSDIPDNFLQASLFRGFRPLLEVTPSYSVVRRAFNKLSKKSPKQLWESLGKPEEPFAAVLHGCINQDDITFTYNEENHVEGMKLSNFGMSRYGDPVADLSSFLFMNVSAELRRDGWEDFLRAYWEGVTSVVSDPGFTFKECERNLARKAIYGYIVASCYVPMAATRTTESDIWKLTYEEQAEFGLSNGGEEATKAVTDIVCDLFTFGYLEDYLQSDDL